LATCVTHIAELNAFIYFVFFPSEGVKQSKEDFTSSEIFSAVQEQAQTARSDFLVDQMSVFVAEGGLYFS